MYHELSQGPGFMPGAELDAGERMMNTISHRSSSHETTRVKGGRKHYKWDDCLEVQGAVGT